MDNIVDYGKSKVKTKKCSKKKGRTRIRTGVAWIKTKSDNHYTIQPFYVFLFFMTSINVFSTDHVTCQFLKKG